MPLSAFPFSRCFPWALIAMIFAAGGCRNAPAPFDPFAGSNRMPPPNTGAFTPTMAPGAYSPTAPGYAPGAPQTVPQGFPLSSTPPPGNPANPSVFGAPAPPPNNPAWNGMPTGTAAPVAANPWGVANPKSGSWVGGGSWAAPSASGESRGYESPSSSFMAATPPQGRRGAMQLASNSAAMGSNGTPNAGMWDWIAGSPRSNSYATPPSMPASYPRGMPMGGAPGTVNPAGSMPNSMGVAATPPYGVTTSAAPGTVAGNSATTSNGNPFYDNPFQSVAGQAGPNAPAGGMNAAPNPGAITTNQPRTTGPGTVPYVSLQTPPAGTAGGVSADPYQYPGRPQNRVMLPEIGQLPESTKFR
ncbi:MAG: hypothetical protein SFX18_15595 [Pirellulales bacterium]|nr:hypothetical protein [Pirellulales bacterium]